MSLKKILFLCLVICALSSYAVELSRESKVSYKVSGEAHYYITQTIKNTKTKVKKTGLYPIKLVGAETPRILTDGKSRWNSSVRTYFWHKQLKKIIVRFDLGGICKVNKVQIWLNASLSCDVNQMELQFSQTGDSDVDWVDEIVVKNTKKITKKNTIYPITAENLNKTARYIKVTCVSKKAMIALGEVKIFGERLAESKAVTIAKETWRLDKAAFIGNYEKKTGGFLFEKMHGTLHLKTNKKIYFWIKYFKKALQVKLNGKEEKMPYKRKALWQRLKLTASGSKINYSISAVKAYKTIMYGVIFTTNPNFNPNEIAYSYKKLPLAKRKTGFLEDLLAKKPNISIPEFTAALRKNYKLPDTKTKFFHSHPIKF